VSDQDSVKAEYVNDFELGGRLNGATFTAKVNLFYMDFTDEITPVGVFIPEVFAQLTKNVSSSYRTGVELEWSWDLMEQLSFTGNTTFMKSEIQEFVDDNTSETIQNVVPILSPEWLLNGTFTYKYRKLAELSLSGRYGSESFLELTNDPNLTMPSFFVTSMQLSFRFWKNHTFTFQVNNIFDELYFTNGAPVDVNFDGSTDGPGYLVQSPRHYFGILKFRF